MSFQRSNLPVTVGNGTAAPSLADMDEESSTAGLSLAQLISIFRAYWKTSVLSLFALVFAFAFIIKMLPKSYVATATLIVSRGDKDPLANADFPTGWANTYIPTQIQIIESPVVLGPVIQRLHLLSDPHFTAGFRGPPAALREAVLLNLDKSLNVYQGPGSDLLYVSAASKSPRQAASIANAVATVYLQLNRQEINRPAAERAKVYSKELAQLRKSTVDAQDKVAAFRQRHGMIDLAPGNNDEAEVALDDLEQKLLSAENNERNLEAHLTSRAWGNGASEANSTRTLAGKLAEEESSLARMRETLGPRHPDVLELQSQISATKQAIAAGISSQLAASRRLVEQYTAAVQDQRNLVLKRRRVQDKGTKLMLELQSAEATYKRALDRYPQIEFASTGGFSDVSLVSFASPPVQATRPHKMKYFLASCVLSFMLAFGLPFAYELLVNRRLRCRDDLERHFGIPVLAQFGPLPERGAAPRTEAP